MGDNEFLNHILYTLFGDDRMRVVTDGSRTTNFGGDLISKSIWEEEFSNG